jgi:integrase
MSVAKDPKTGKWYSKFRYTDWTGKRVQKKKTGFVKKSDAQAWEMEFLTKASLSCDMSFKSMVELYMEDCKTRLKPTTWENKNYLISTKLLPVFGDTPINEITPIMIRNWQNLLMQPDQNNGDGYSKTYLKTINNQLSAILNYAVRYYNLANNPAAITGSMGKGQADTMLFWTEEEYKTFIKAINKPTPYCMFNILFYTGIREGELLALSLSDFDFQAQVLHITKNYAVVKGKEYIFEPKTPKSKRDITLPAFLCKIVQDYASRLVDYSPDERLFPFTKSYVNYQMQRGCKASGVKKIRVHDLRHSHASLLIKMGYPILLVKERMGHEKIQTTLQLYGHLYPDVHGNVADQLDQQVGTDLAPAAWQDAIKALEN